MLVTPDQIILTLPMLDVPFIRWLLAFLVVFLGFRILARVWDLVGI